MRSARGKIEWQASGKCMIDSLCLLVYRAPKKVEALVLDYISSISVVSSSMANRTGNLMHQLGAIARYDRMHLGHYIS